MPTQLEKQEYILKTLLNANGYYNLILHFTPLEAASNYKSYLHIACSICNVHKKIDLPWDVKNDKECLEYLVEHCKVFGKDHNHGKEPEYFSFAQLQDYIKQISGNRVEVNLINPETSHYLLVRCNYCQCYIKIATIVFGNNFKSYVSNIEEFIKQHSHNKLENQKMYYQTPFIPTNSKTPVNISQEILKEIYKLSDFNIELQAKILIGPTVDYRAICVRCNETVGFNINELISNDRNNITWTNIKVFCTTHKHLPVFNEIRFGRKFKEVK